MIDTCYLSKDEKSFFVSTVEGKVIVYNLPSFQQTTTLDYKNVNDQRFSIDRDEHFVLVSNSQGVFRTACPISTKNPVIISNNINIPEIKKFLNDQREGDQAINNNWIIAPFMVNSLHYYSFKNEKIYLKPAMIAGSPYLKSTIGTPLDISIIKGNTEATGTIINQLKKRLPENNYALETLSDCLIDLNLGGFKGLEDLYNECLIPSKQKKLPDSCAENIELPIVTYALTFQVNPEVFLGKNIEEGGKRISFLISTIRMNLEIGSSESIAFLESLLKCSNTEIFKTKFIQAILNDKWTRIR